MKYFFLEIHIPLAPFDKNDYSRTSMARKLMARLPWLFRTLSLSPLEKHLIAADLG